MLEHGQVVGRLVYEKMAEVPEQLYGAGIASNYQGQGLKLSKHFKTPELITVRAERPSEGGNEVPARFAAGKPSV